MNVNYNCTPNYTPTGPNQVFLHPLTFKNDFTRPPRKDNQLHQHKNNQKGTTLFFSALLQSWQ